MSSKQTRRRFFKTSALAAATLSLGTYIESRAEGANDKIVLALVGCGNRGMSTITACCKGNPNVEIKTVCDVNRSKLANAVNSVEKSFGKAPKAAEDMKTIFDDKDVNAVWIATPEHWHTLASIWACQAGKDVYVEKNPSVNIWEGRQLVKAAEKYKRVVQVGFQNRSAPYAFSAKKYIEEGKLGKIVTIKSYCMLGGGKSKLPPDAPIPAWLDWDKWLGPAPMRPFNPAIVSESGRGGWLNFWAYGGGALSDDASHVLDVARMVVGDPPHPKSVYTVGGNYVFGGDRETPEFEEILYDFGNFSWSCSSGYATGYMVKTPGDVRSNKEKFPNWANNATRTEIYGTKGLMYFGRHGGGWQVLGSGGKIIDQDGGTFPDPEHQKDFITSLRTRKKPNGDAEQCHRSACLVHLGHLSYRAGNKQLLFDSEKETFLNSEEANVLARGTYRKGYEVPAEV
ncbi:MAG: Gfo/Idh/MocA family oxidoreductase [Planctomycetaceae bacterium]|nr:Gfo/Idh/MocA family oxidoreductase [Planctomycetaceae bacterium]